MAQCWSLVKLRGKAPAVLYRQPTWCIALLDGTLEDGLNIKPEVRRSFFHLLLSSASFSFLLLIDVDMVNVKLLFKLIYSFRDYMKSYPQVSTHKYRHLSVIEAGLALAKTKSIILRSVVE